MEPFPDPAQSYPPPPPPQRSRKGLWVGLAIGAVVLCLCCIILVGVILLRQDIPIISNFFPPPPPAGLYYDNPSAGISLTYPATWQFVESGDASSGYEILFSSSVEFLNDPTALPTSGAILDITTNTLPASDIPFAVEASSMNNVVDYIATNLFSGFSQSQNSKTFTLSGYPAGSGAFTGSVDPGVPSVAYLTVVLRNEEILLFLGMCHQTEWVQYQPTFDSILNSVRIVTP
jgi:hypothetical protein